MDRVTQYATTTDGIRIAYSTKGRGMPLIELPPIPFSHGAGPAEVPQWQAWDEEIARRGMLVDYDCRGAGMSKREVTDFSLDAWVRDVEAVVEAVGSERVTLFAPDSLAVPTAIAYAVQHPERVAHLVLWQAHTSVREMISDPAFATVLQLIDSDWVLFSQVLVQFLEGFPDPAAGRKEAEMMRELHTPLGIKAALRFAEEIDVADLLPSVQVPTLVMHRRDGRHPLRDSTLVASAIPGAKLVTIDGTSFGWAMEHADAVLRAIDDFLGWRPAAGSPPAGDISLSPREREVLQLVAQGKSSREIGLELALAVRTVERHISNIYDKIGARNRAQATSIALERGLLRHD